MTEWETKETANCWETNKDLWPIQKCQYWLKCKHSSHTVNLYIVYLWGLGSLCACPLRTKGWKPVRREAFTDVETALLSTNCKWRNGLHSANGGRLWRHDITHSPDGMLSFIVYPRLPKAVCVACSKSWPIYYPTIMLKLICILRRLRNEKIM